MRIIVAGWMAALPSAGVLWHPLGFALGFRGLGHDVWLFEDSGDTPWGYDPETDSDDPDCAAGARFLARELADVGLGDRWIYRHVPTGRWEGLDRRAAEEVFAEADVLINVSLTTPMRPEYHRVPHRVGIDTDPVFTQVRIAQGDDLLSRVPEWHTRLFTYGRPPLPGQRHEWLPTRQPIATSCWPVADPPDPKAALTSVMTWRAYPPVVWEGSEYAGKDKTFLRFLDLPQRSASRLRLALGAGQGRAEGAALLDAHGWELADPIAATRSTQAYQAYMASSLGEICLAKHGYVAARSGWFSERTCLYLASGRPVVAQETGWTDWLPAGEGALAFSTLNEAVAAIEEVGTDSARHAAAARRLAIEHFRAEDVCAEILAAL